MDEAVVRGQVVLGQEVDLERGLGDAGEPRLIGRPGLLVEVAPKPVRDVVVGEPLLGDLGVAVVEPARLGLELVQQGTFVVDRSPSWRSAGFRLSSLVLGPWQAEGVHVGQPLIDQSGGKS